METLLPIDCRSRSDRPAHLVDLHRIDGNEDIVQSLNGQLTHVVRADSTKEETLRQLSIPDFDRVVVAIGSDIEASILTTSLLLRLNIKHV